MKLIIETKEVQAENAIIMFTTKEAPDKLELVIDPKLPFDAAIRSIFTTSLHLLKSYEKVAPGAKEAMYDAFNIMASSVLEQFAPELEQRPDISAEAILAKENELIEKKFEELTPEQKAQAKANVEKLRSQLTADKEAADNAKDQAV